jgi:glycosyltransferase involved in cell wall biosynthesis
MKILIVSESNNKGGAAKAAYRLHKALLKNDINSTMLVQNKQGDDYSVIGPNSKIERALAIIRPTLEQWIIKKHIKDQKALFSSAKLSNNKIINAINDIDPDIVHLHWVCGGTLSIEDLLKIKKPIVWTMHDNWLFTGGCHIKYKCEKFAYHCGHCPYLGSKIKKDLSYHVFERKMRIISEKKNIYVVALCKKFTEYAQKSVILQNKPIYLIPNPIDVSVYKPIDKNTARRILNIPENKKIILFGAINPLKDDNKGSQLLLAALYKIVNNNIELLIIGASKPKKEFLPLPTRYLGHLNDDFSLVLAYNAADIVVVPSKQETLSNMVMESLSCGTPVIAFNVGGNSDMIIHGKNGYLAEPYSIDDFAKGINEILTKGKGKYLDFAVNYIREKYSEDIVAEQMKNLYSYVLEHTKNDKDV